MKQLLFIVALVLICATNQAATASTASAKAKQHNTATAMRPSLTLDSALVIAKATVPTGTVKAHELEREHGHLIYSFEFVVAGKSGIEEVNVDAMTGAVLAVEHEGPKAEHRESVQEKRETSKAKTTH